MEVLCNNYMPGDPRLVDRLLSELKSQGIFDQFRKECISDVDTKPAYQNLRQRVEGTVTSFLSQQTWSIDLNKNQLREQLRKNLHESGFLETGVERIVDQVVNPKISTVFLPKVEDVVYRFLGIEKPAARIIKKEEKRVSITDLLPTDLEAVSPESVSSFKNERKNDSLNDSLNSSGKMEEDESPPFEPLSIQTSHDNSNLLSDKMQIEENSRDSHLSGFSGLQSHESHHDSDTKNYQMELSNQDSLNSSETHLSIVTSEDTTKMEICEDSNTEIKIEKVEIKSDELDISAESESVFVFKDVKIEESVAENTNERCEEDKKDNKHEKLEDRKSRSLEKSRDKKDDKYKKSSSSKDKEKSSSKYSSKDKDTNKKDPKSSSSHNRDKDKSKERTDKDKSSTRYKYEKEKDKSKSEKDKKVEKSKSDKEMANRDEKERSEKDRSSKLDKSKSEKEKSNREKDKYKSDKDKYSKDKEKSKYKDNAKVKSATDKFDKDRSSTSKEKSERDKNSKEKSLKDKHSSSKDKNKENDKDKSKNSSSSSSSNSKHGFGKDKKKESNSKEKSSSNKDSTKNTDAKSSDKLKKEETKPSSNRKDSRDSKKKSKDDHYSSKIKKTDRRSTDRDSNDGTSSKTNYLNNTYSESMSSRSENNSQDHSSSSFSGGSGDSGNSDQTELLVKEVSETGFENRDTNVNNLFFVTQVQPVKYIKPKFASNFEEARKIMKIRKQLAKLERHNQLSLARIDVPHENGIANRQASSSAENVLLKERLLNNNSKKTDLDNKDIPTKEVILNTDKIPISNSNTVETDNLKEVTIRNTQISMQNFEALEEMSKINYNSYESDDDYEFHGYSSSDKTQSSDNPFQNHQSDNDNLPRTKFEKCDEDSKILNPKVAIKVDDGKFLFDGNPCGNHKDRDVCRYLEKPSSHEENNLKFIHNVIAKFEREIKDCIETSRNNFWTANRGKKRKLEECVDFKNNNEIEFTVKKRRGSTSSNTVISKANKKRMCNNTDITPVEHFSLPLSPAESDKSNERKEEDLLIPMKQKRIIRGYSQRYSSDELYKPRPIIGRRNRFPKNTL